MPAWPRIASALDYPTRPVRIVAGFAAGGGVDITARLIGQWLTDRLGQSFAAVPNAVNTSLYPKLSFNFIRDIAAVGGIIRVPMIIMVHPDMPFKTVPELIAYAKANPGKISMASAGNGSAPHMAGELFKMMAAVDMLHVPYRGQGPALTDLLSGEVQLLFATAPGTSDYVKTGKLRALAVTTATRAEVMPELPPIADFVPGYVTSQWYGLCAPKGVPEAIVATLNKEINAAIADPALKARLEALGGEPLPGTPADFGKLIAEETEKWAKVVTAAGLKPE